MLHMGALPGTPLFDPGLDLVAGRAGSAVFSPIPDAVLVSGQLTGEEAALSDLEAVKAVLPDIAVMANTGVKHDSATGESFRGSKTPREKTCVPGSARSAAGRNQR